MIGPADGFDLPFLPRRPQAFALAVGGNPDPANHGLNVVARRERGFQGLQTQDDVTVRSHQPVGVGIERPAAGGADRLGLREQHQAIGMHIRRPAHNRHLDLAQLERSSRVAQGPQ